MKPLKYLICKDEYMTNISTNFQVCISVALK